MKIYISADIEGVAGIAAAAEANMAVPSEYQPFRRQMEAEVIAACRGAFTAGAREIVIKDAHASGRNLQLHDFTVPEDRSVRLIRGWSGHPFGMVQDIDESFAAAVFIGFHCAAGQAGNPLAHTLNGALFSRVELNGEPASELRLYGLAAAMVNVPVIFVSGDRTVCEEARALVPDMTTVTTLHGIGPSVTTILPGDAVRRIEAQVTGAIGADMPAPIALPERFDLKVEFRHAADAYARSFFPGVRQISDRQLQLASDDYLRVLSFLRFASRYA